jgi:hypothetical protein
MRLEPLYRVRFSYPEAHFVELEGERGVESEHFFIADGRVDGSISGRFGGANHPHRRAYPESRRQVVGTMTHVSSDERYKHLDDVVCVLVGEVRDEIVLDVAELVWEPLVE